MLVYRRVSEFGDGFGKKQSFFCLCHTMEVEIIAIVSPPPLRKKAPIVPLIIEQFAVDNGPMAIESSLIYPSKLVIFHNVMIISSSSSSSSSIFEFPLGDRMILYDII